MSVTGSDGGGGHTFGFKTGLGLAAVPASKLAMRMIRRCFMLRCDIADYGSVITGSAAVFGPHKSRKPTLFELLGVMVVTRSSVVIVLVVMSCVYH